MEGNGLGALLVSVGLLIASAIVLIPKYRHLTRGERTVGIVVGHKNYGYGSSDSVRAPVVRYSAPGGVYDTLGSLPAARSIYPLGKEVSVLYLRNDPSNAVIADFVQLFLIPTVVGGLGLICLTGTAALQFWTVRSEVRTSKSVVTRRQFAVADAANKDDANKDATNNDAANSDAADNDTANDDVANDDDVEDPNRQREHHAVAGR